MKSTTLRWGPTSDRLADLRDFRARLIRYCENARAKQNEIRVYALMLPDLEKELIEITARIQARQRRYARRQPAAAIA